MLRFHATIAGSLVLLVVGTGVATADDADQSQASPRYQIAAQLSSLDRIESTPLSLLDMSPVEDQLDAVASPLHGDEVRAGGVVNDTPHTRLSAFSTGLGAVCFSAARKSFDTPIDGAPFASGCFDRLQESGIQEVVTFNRDGIRVFGVAGDDVSAVEVTTASGTTTRLATRTNSFAWHSPDRSDVPAELVVVRGDERVVVRLEFDHLDS